LRTLDRHQERTSPHHILIKTLSTQNKKTLKVTREKHHDTYKGKLVKITDFSTETLEAKRSWNDVF
jgi:hypothetical protein